MFRPLSWLRNCLSGNSTARSPRVTRRPSVRLAIESLEDRIVPTNSVVPTITINGGAPAYTDCNGQSISLVGQSSAIEQILVTFSKPVTLDDDAFTITNLAPAVTVLAGPNPNTFPVTAIQKAVPDTGDTQWIVTFAGDGTYPVNGGTGAIIRDGLYLLTTNGSRVHA